MTLYHPERIWKPGPEALLPVYYRHDELQAISRALYRTPDDNPTLPFIYHIFGPPGIGKSALLAQAVKLPPRLTPRELTMLFLDAEIAHAKPHTLIQFRDWMLRRNQTSPLVVAIDRADRLGPGGDREFTNYVRDMMILPVHRAKPVIFVLASRIPSLHHLHLQTESHYLKRLIRPSGDRLPDFLWNISGGHPGSMQIMAKAFESQFARAWRNPGFQPPITAIGEALKIAVKAFAPRSIQQRDEIFALATLNSFSYDIYQEFMIALGHPEFTWMTESEIQPRLEDLTLTNLTYWREPLAGIYPPIRHVILQHKKINLPNIQRHHEDVARQVFAKLYIQTHQPSHLNELAYHLHELVGLGDISPAGAVQNLLQTAQTPDIRTLVAKTDSWSPLQKNYILSLLLRST